MATVGGAARERLRRCERPLLVLLGLGLAMRIFVVASYWPGDFGWADGPRLARMWGDFFDEFFIPAGYGAFAVGLRELWPNLAVLIVVQHLLGLVAGALFYAGMRRLGASAAIACVPAAVVLLGGDFLYMEHVVLAESLFVFGTAVTFWLAARTADTGRLSDALLTGAAVAGTGLVRQTGLVLVPVVAVWVAWSFRGTARRRLIAGGATAGVAAAIVAAYVGVVAIAGGYTGLTGSSAWHLYARVAPIADCAKFRPPPGTENLCESTPTETRPGPEWYLISLDSPAAKAFGRTEDGEIRPVLAQDFDADKGPYRRWARAVMLGQTRDYLRLVARELWRGVDPGAGRANPHEGDPIYGFAPRTLDTEQGHVELFRRKYTVPDVRVSNQLFLASYTRATRLVGLPVLAAVILIALGLAFGAGPTRRAAALPAVMGILLALAPVAAFTYGLRYFLPAQPLLVAAAALGAAALVERRRLRAMTAGSPAAA